MSSVWCHRLQWIATVSRTERIATELPHFVDSPRVLCPFIITYEALYLAYPKYGKISKMVISVGAPSKKLAHGAIVLLCVFTLMPAENKKLCNKTSEDCERIILMSKITQHYGPPTGCRLPNIPLDWLPPYTNTVAILSTATILPHWKQVWSLFSDGWKHIQPITSLRKWNECEWLRFNTPWAMRWEGLGEIKGGPPPTWGSNSMRNYFEFKNRDYITVTKVRNWNWARAKFLLALCLVCIVIWFQINKFIARPIFTIPHSFNHFFI